MNWFKRLFKKEVIDDNYEEITKIKKLFIEEDIVYRQDDEFNCIKKSIVYRIFQLEGEFKEYATYDDIISKGYYGWKKYLNWDGTHWATDKLSEIVKVYTNLEDALIAKEFFEYKLNRCNNHDIRWLNVNKELNTTKYIRYNHR